MINHNQKTISKNGFFLSTLIVIALVSGCDKSSSHWSWTCDNNRRDLDLICEMSKSIPNAYKPEQLHPMGLCRSVETDYYESHIDFYFQKINDDSGYSAIGGYCDFHARFDDILDYLEETDTSFDNMLFQVHSCAPDRYEDLNLRAEALGLQVTSHRLSDCEDE